MGRQFKAGTPWGDAIDVLVSIAEEEFGAGYVIEKAAPELRYSLGPLYSPGVRDAHNEFATSEDLREALWDFNLNGDRTLRKQHGSQKSGDIVELYQLPFEHTAELSVGDVKKSYTFPAGTVYCGAVWTPESWAELKAGKRTGFSMGGTAIRIPNAMDDADLMKFS